MARRRLPPPLTAWEWLCGWARQQGVDPERVRLPEAAEHLVTALEQKRAAGDALPRAMVPLAALLVKVTGELEIEGTEPTWATAQSPLELAFARRRAAALERLREQAPLLRAKPEIAKPDEPPEEASVTVFEMVRTLQQAMEKPRRIPVPRPPE